MSTNPSVKDLITQTSNEKDTLINIQYTPRDPPPKRVQFHINCLSANNNEITLSHISCVPADICIADPPPEIRHRQCEAIVKFTAQHISRVNEISTQLYTNCGDKRKMIFESKVAWLGRVEPMVLIFERPLCLRLACKTAVKEKIMRVVEVLDKGGDGVRIAC